MRIEAHGYSLEAPNRPLTRRAFVIEAVRPAHAVVQVAGCGLCHTDLSFYSGQVKPKQMPVILGHEISGTVVAVGAGADHLLNKRVVVPAVLPCGDCGLCRSGRANICQHQEFPGNDFDGGFATHVVVPSRFLCPVPTDLRGLQLAELCVVADAITTPYQALMRSGVKPGELAVVVGVGGVGTYMVQHARNAGAKVLALDVDANKLARARAAGAHHVLDVTGMAEGDAKKAVRDLVKTHELPPYGWRVFETSGTADGQRLAFALLSYAGTLVVVGFTMDKVDIRLSNVMAFDAEVIGNWACKPEYYPQVVDDVVARRVNVKDNIEMFGLDEINDVIGRALLHKLERRAVLVP